MRELHKLYRKHYPKGVGYCENKFEQDFVAGSFQHAMTAFAAAVPGAFTAANNPAMLKMMTGSTLDPVGIAKTCAEQDMTEDDLNRSVMARGGHYVWVRWTYEFGPEVSVNEAAANLLSRGTNGLITPEVV